MSSSMVLTQVSDTYVNEAAPDEVNRFDPRLRLRTDTGEDRFAYLSFGALPPAGANIISATLFLTLAEDWDDSQYILVESINERWSVNGTTYNNQPDHGFASASSDEILDEVANTRIEIDVTSMIANAVAGMDFFGFFLSVDTDELRALYSSEQSVARRRPSLEIVYSFPPGQATDLSPSMGRQVSIAQPTGNWSGHDPDGDGQAKYQLQIAVESEHLIDGATEYLSTPEFESGWVAQKASQALFGGPTNEHQMMAYTAGDEGDEHKLTFDGDEGTVPVVFGPAGFVTLASVIAAVDSIAGITEGVDIIVTSPDSNIFRFEFAGSLAGADQPMLEMTSETGAAAADFTEMTKGLADWEIDNGDTRHWRVRTQDMDGLIGPWSAIATFGRTDKGALAITAPTGNVLSLDPTITHTFDDQESVEHILERDDGDGGWVRVFEKLRTVTGALSLQIPLYQLDHKCIDRAGVDFRLTVRGWDGVNREATPGDPTYSEDSVTFQFETDGDLPIPTDVIAAGFAPYLRVDWHYEDPFDFFAIYADGIFTQGQRITPEDLGDDNYRFQLETVRPGTHEIGVEAVVLDGGIYKHSDPGIAADAVTGDPDTVTYEPQGAFINGIQILGVDAAPAISGKLYEGRTDFQIQGRPKIVSIYDSLGGWRGSVAGAIDIEDLEEFDTFQALASEDAEFQFVFADQNITVTLTDVNHFPLIEDASRSLELVEFNYAEKPGDD